MLVGGFEIEAFPQRFAVTIAGAAQAWQMGVWPKTARPGNREDPYLSTSTDPNSPRITGFTVCPRSRAGGEHLL